MSKSLPQLNKRTLYVCECGVWGRWQDEEKHRQHCAMDSTTAEYVPAAALAGLLAMLSDPVLDGQTVRLATDDVLRFLLDEPKATEPRTWEKL